MTFKHIVHDLTTGAIRVETMTARTPKEARAEFQRMIDDCPECQALRARGEVPTVVHLPRQRMRDRFRRPRWRDLRKRARR